MNNFTFGGGGKQRRDEYIGGRPKSDANYGPKKKRFDKKPSFRGNNDRGSDRELFKTNCTTCGKPCEVPFRPDGSKPVLCRDCFAKNHPADRSDFKSKSDFSRGNDRGFKKPDRPLAPQPDLSQVVALTKQVAALESKLDQVLALLRTTATPAVAAHTTDANPEAGESETPKKARTAKKVAVPKKVTKKAAKKATKKKAS